MTASKKHFWMWKCVRDVGDWALQWVDGIGFPTEPISKERIYKHAHYSANTSNTAVAHTILVHARTEIHRHCSAEREIPNSSDASRSRMSAVLARVHWKYALWLLRGNLGYWMLVCDPAVSKFSGRYCTIFKYFVNCVHRRDSCTVVHARTNTCVHPRTLLREHCSPHLCFAGPPDCDVHSREFQLSAKYGFYRLQRR